jgi:predicted RNase H-like HicB family nuclease
MTTVQIWREGEQYVAHAMPIDVTSCGDTPASARAAVDEAVRLFVRTAAEAGTLDEVLEECGYECQDGTWNSPEYIALERHALAI